MTNELSISQRASVQRREPFSQAAPLLAVDISLLEKLSLSGFCVKLDLSTTPPGLQSVRTASNFRSETATDLVAETLSPCSAERAAALVASCLASKSSYGMSQDDRMERSRILIALLQRYPADVADQVVHHYLEKGSRDVPTTDDFTKPAEKFMGVRRLLADAISEAPHAPSDEDGQRQPSGLVQAIPRYNRSYSDYPERAVPPSKNMPGIPASGWLEQRYPENKPDDEGYQPPDMGEEITELRSGFVGQHGEIKARTWFDQCRCADLDEKILYAPSALIADRLNDEFSKGMGKWKAEGL